MRRFWLFRSEDVSGTSGTGLVAEGCEFHTGECALFWLGTLHSHAIYESVATLERIHGHGGRTKVVWADAERSAVGRWRQERARASVTSFRARSGTSCLRPRRKAAAPEETRTTSGISANSHARRRE